MPLSAPVERDPVHVREITCRGFRRRDGLWDIEAHLTDVKSYSFTNDDRGTIAAGEPLHEMWMRLTIDSDYLIHGVEAATDHSPFHICPAVVPHFQRLVGLSIARGFKRAVRERLGGVEGCTHLVELLGPLATTAFQTLAPMLARERSKSSGQKGGPPGSGDTGRPPLLGTCHAFAASSPVVERYWPAYYEPSGGTEGDQE
ncbi:DUF2889 domain-containing protein [Radicibacter daui]|uniref:DUF2889 domain-containing protein n=1 Tax=Radicibacter daui TaxID=3064829 RepID=UPI0040469145